MNVTESTHVQQLIRWLTDPHLTGPADEDAADAAGVAAAFLADAAYRRLGAGPTGGQVTHAWADRLTTCPGCPDCEPNSTDQAEEGDQSEDRAQDVAVGAPMWDDRPWQDRP